MGCERIGLRAILQVDEHLPLLPVVAVYVTAIVARSVQVVSMHRQRLDALAVRTAAVGPIRPALVAEEACGLVNRRGVEFAPEDDQPTDRVRLRQPAAI